MKVIIAGLAAILALGSVSSTANAQTVYLSPVTCQPLGRAPDMMTGGYYVMSPHGCWYGPNYYVYPPWAPWGGALPAFNNGPAWHNYARSPRDFFMWSDMLEERIARERRPALVP